MENYSYYLYKIYTYENQKKKNNIFHLRAYKRFPYYVMGKNL